MKNVLIIATGGTVASTDSGEGLKPGVSGENILSMVPGVTDLCNINVIQPMNIDSSNMSGKDWLIIAETILTHYDDYDGFVVLHGTDTMAYTAAALSYLIQNSTKPIVLTGSQRPIEHPFTDAKLNIYQSILYAIDDKAFDVSVVFHGKAICGTRVKKQRTRSFDAFESMNYPVLANFLEERIVHSINTSTTNSNKLTTYDKLSSRVAIIKLIPGLSASIFETFKNTCDVLVLETFGVGGIPEYKNNSFEAAIDKWIDSGRTIILTTQVPEEGLDLSRYEVGNRYVNIDGILEAGDMTTEAIVAKIMYILGRTTSQKEIKELFYEVVNSDRGEF
ncbi:MAG: asparaginase [Suipraeoptans sp.]